MNKELTEAKYDAAVGEIVNIISAVMERLVAIADKNNIDLIFCLVKLISAMAEISTFKILNESKSEKCQDFCNKSTASLVKELEKREGVETYIAEPYADLEVKVNGPAIVLVVID